MYYKQFLLTQHDAHLEINWKLRTVGKYHLQTHPELSTTEKRSDGYHLVMLGYWYDHRNPTYSDQQIIDNLNINVSVGELQTQLDHLCGVFLLLFATPDKLYVIPDFCALAEAFILQRNDEVLAIAASPELLEKVEPLVEDTDHPFYSTDLFKARMLWIGTSTSFKHVLRLRPNHYLDVSVGRMERFYPLRKLEKQPLDVVVKRVVEMLPNFMKAVFNRDEKLMIGLTAGWDSRLLLAACREIKDKVIFFVDISSSEKQDSVIPERLAHKFDLSFNKIRFSSKASIDQSAFKSRFTPPITAWKLAVFDNLFGSCKTLTGSVSEIARNEFARINNLDGKKLTALARFPNNEFVTSQFDHWYNTNKALFEANGYQVLDMFYWEEVLGKVSRLITDAQQIDRVVFPAFNCRYLMETLLSADEKYRDKQHNILYAEAIKLMWKETLEEPVNPSIKKSVIRAMQKLGVYGLYRNIFTTGVLKPKAAKK